MRRCLTRKWWTQFRTIALRKQIKLNGCCRTNLAYLLKPTGAFKSTQIKSNWLEWRRSTGPPSHRSAGRDGGIRQNHSDRLISWNKWMGWDKRSSLRLAASGCRMRLRIRLERKPKLIRTFWPQRSWRESSEAESQWGEGDVGWGGDGGEWHRESVAVRFHSKMSRKLQLRQLKKTKKKNMASWSHFHNLFAVFVQLSRTHSRNTSSMALQTKRKKDTLPFFFFSVLKWNQLATSILPSNTPRFNNYQILVGKLLMLIWQVIQHPADASSLGHILRWLPK